MKAKLAFKFAIFTACILAFSFWALGIFFITTQRSVVIHDLEQMASALATNLAANSAYGLVTRDRSQLKTLLASLASVRDIKFSWIEDQNGKLLASFGDIPLELLQEIHIKLHANHKGYHNGTNASTETYRPGEMNIILKSTAFPRLIIASARVIEPAPENKEALVLGSHPDRGKRVILGRVVVAMSLNRAEKDITSAKEKSLAIISIVAILSMLLTIAMVHVITRPLSKLKIAAEEIMVGLTPRFVTVKSSDEIGELADAFNEMVRELMSRKKALEKAYAELENVNISLEEKVAQRTKVLQETVEQLTCARDALEKAYNDMKAMYQAKAVFIRTASHELRTPLTAIIANISYMQTYLAKDMEEDAREIVDTVLKNSNSMRLMVEDMLTMLRIDSESIPLTIEKANLKTLVSEAVKELKGLQEGRTTRINIPDDIYLECDSARFHDLCFNMLSNAYKATGNDGEITVSASRHDGKIVIKIKDNGEGIPAEHLKDIFEPFYQVHPGRMGSGLGLAIVKTVVDRHNGAIHVESTPGKGTVFTIIMPAHFKADEAEQDIRAY